MADDSPVCRKLVELTLSQRGYSVVFATSGREAMNLFEKHRPALVITDWSMPDLDGIDLCRWIRLNPLQFYTYIIMLTSVAEKENVVKGLTAGADDYLTKPFDPQELLARVAVALRITDLHRQIEAKNRRLEELAITDGLTGLPNRRAIEDWAGAQLSNAVRHEFPFWVVMADLDCLKQVNDNYGHDAGDTVLKRFAEILKTNSRRANICGRIGGDEFLIVLTHVSRQGARTAIERICEQLRTETFRFGRDVITVTASFGIAGYSRCRDQDLNRLVTQADMALYSAKRHGRNQIEIATTETRDVEIV